MSVNVRAVEYFYATVLDKPGEAARVLSLLAESGVNLLAFNIVPVGPSHTQLVIFPESPSHLQTAAQQAHMDLVGPEHALLVQGDDEIGVLVDVHRRLAEANVNVYASSGVTNARGGFGYVIYVRPDEFKAAAGAAKVI